MNVFGIPGVGGSLGSCAFCGENFLMDILVGGKVVQFTCGGNRLAAHAYCFKIHGNKEPNDWPDGPLKTAYDDAMAKEQPK